jgi:hypothetical protein
VEEFNLAHTYSVLSYGSVLMRDRSTTLAPSSLMAPLHARVWQRAKRISVKIATCVAGWHEAYPAAALYNELSKLSDVQLENSRKQSSCIAEYCGETCFSTSSHSSRTKYLPAQDHAAR